MPSPGAECNIKMTVTLSEDLFPKHTSLEDSCFVARFLKHKGFYGRHHAGLFKYICLCYSQNTGVGFDKV